MKKKLFLALALVPMLASCSASETYVPKNSFPGDFVELKVEDMTVNFYLDATHSDEPLYTMRWFMLEPLGECPVPAVLTDANAPDPLYPHFIGYSEYPSSIDEDHIWKFETDYKQSNVLNLYGIWVAK